MCKFVGIVGHQEFGGIYRKNHVSPRKGLIKEKVILNLVENMQLKACNCNFFYKKGNDSPSERLWL